MSDPQIQFDDGAAYEQMMGVWSRLVGIPFLQWISQPPGLCWIEVGCGNGAFSDLLLQHCAPAHLTGIDPSDAQISYARARTTGRPATFVIGDAQSLPFEAGSFDAAVMALVIFFLPQPAKGVAEMARVVRPGSLVATYGWDITGGGLPVEPIQRELRRLGKTPILPPSPEAANMDNLVELWSHAGLVDIETRVFEVERTFASFDEFWNVNRSGPTARHFTSLSPEETAEVRARVRESLDPDASGRVRCRGRANAIKGRLPA